MYTNANSLPSKIQELKSHISANENKPKCPSSFWTVFIVSSSLLFSFIVH